MFRKVLGSLFFSIIRGLILWEFVVLVYIRIVSLFLFCLVLGVVSFFKVGFGKYR